MSTRDEILARLQKSSVKPPALKARHRDFPDLPEQFAQVVSSIGGEVFLLPDLDEVWRKLAEIFATEEITTVVAHHEEPLLEVDVYNRFPDQHFYFPEETEGFRAVCARADAGLTSATWAIAETGTLVLESGEIQARSTSLLPPIHIVLLPKSKLLPSIFEWLPKRPEELPSNLVFVSGPSKTSDIEKVVVVGVHGPERLIVLVYPD
ncbi:MAG: lactate utilization protein [Anaerolineales bacterium]|jgi:L-lactate dehydrogenase complex protein LldG